MATRATVSGRRAARRAHPRGLRKRSAPPPNRITVSDDRYPYLDDAAWRVLAEHRATMRGTITSRRGGVEVDDGEIRWWTFAGGRINSTLRYALEAVGDEWKVIPDNFLIKVRGENVDVLSFRDALARIAETEFWEDERLWADVAESLPNYRLSKFQPLMPPWVEREVIASYLLDVAGAWQWLPGLERSGPRLPEAVRTWTPSDAESFARLQQAPAELPLLRRDHETLTKRCRGCRTFSNQPGGHRIIPSGAATVHTT